MLIARSACDVEECSSMFQYVPDTCKTRRYPWGIQRLVSTHQLPHKSRGAGVRGQVLLYSIPTKMSSAKSCPAPPRPTFLKYLSGDTQGFLSKIFAKPNSGRPCIADLCFSHTTSHKMRTSGKIWNILVALFLEVHFKFYGPQVWQGNQIPPLFRTINLAGKLLRKVAR